MPKARSVHSEELFDPVSPLKCARRRRSAFETKMEARSAGTTAARPCTVSRARVKGPAAEQRAIRQARLADRQACGFPGELQGLLFGDARADSGPFGSNRHARQRGPLGRALRLCPRKPANKLSSKFSRPTSRQGAGQPKVSHDAFSWRAHCTRRSTPRRSAVAPATRSRTSFLAASGSHHPRCTGRRSDAAVPAYLKHRDASSSALLGRQPHPVRQQGRTAFDFSKDLPLGTQARPASRRRPLGDIMIKPL